MFEASPIWLAVFACLGTIPLAAVIGLVVWLVVRRSRPLSRPELFERPSIRSDDTKPELKVAIQPAPVPRPAFAAEDAVTQPPAAAEDVTRAPDPRPLERDSSLIDFLSPPQAADEIGRLGGFRILKVLGQGGMGVVFQGEDTRLGRLVAIKAMLPHMVQSRTSQQRFIREARAAAALNHDHIVVIHHVDEDRGAPFIVMPLLQGEPLDARLQRERTLPIAEVLRIGGEIAEGLAAAHKAGMIHRDIKPANIWLETSTRPGSEGGRVKILDFGLARAAAEQSSLTQSGAIIGTPAYMAPEQTRGGSVDARCDLWSLGVVLYRMCTGDVPFKGADAIATLIEVATHDPPSPREINAAIPPALSALVMRLLAKDVSQRIATADQVVARLHDFESHRQSDALAENIKAASSDDWPMPRSKPSERGATPLAEPGLADWWLGKPIQTRRFVKAILWVLMLVAAVCFGGFNRHTEFPQGLQGPQTEKLEIGLIQPWYVSQTNPNAFVVFTRSWSLLTVSGAAGVLSLICLAWLLAIRRWDRAGKPALTPEETRDKIRLAGGWLIATGLVILVSWIPAFICFVVLETKGLAAGDHGYWQWPLIILHNFWSAAAGIVVLRAGIQLRRLRGYELAIAAPILAIVPFSVGVILGLPVGIWCLSLLRRREVRDEFQRTAWLAKNREFQSTAS